MAKPLLSVEECMTIAKRYCTDYKTATYESDDIIDIWFDYKEFIKFRIAIERKSKNKVNSKDLIDYTMSIAKNFSPKTADTYNWDMIWLTKNQLQQVIERCLI